MKILLVNKFFFIKGGAERYMFTLSDALKKSGHEVVYFSMQDKRNFNCEQSKYFVSPVSMTGSLKSKFNMVFHIAYSKEAFKKMTKLLINEKPDLVILNNIHKQLTCSVIDAIKKYNENLPIYWVCHDLITICPAYTMINGHGKICEKCINGNFSNCFKEKCIHNSKLLSLLSTYEAIKIKHKNWYSYVDKFICPSNFYKRKLEESKYIKAPIVLLRNPMPMDAPLEINDHDKGYFLYFGRLSKEKGVRSLIDAVQCINYPLVIVGTGPLEKELKEYVNKKKITNVEFYGFKKGDELTDIIRNSRAVVIPSEWYENGPYSAIEAMALGKPLIVSNLGGLPELVSDKVNGLIFDSIEKLRDSITYMINLSMDEYSLMCEESYNRAYKLHLAEDYVEKLLKEEKK